MEPQYKAGQTFKCIRGFKGVFTNPQFEKGKEYKVQSVSIFGLDINNGAKSFYFTYKKRLGYALFSQYFAPISQTISLHI